MQDLRSHLRRVSDLKDAFICGRDPRNPSSPLPYGPAYAELLSSLIDELRVEIATIIRTLHREYLEARRQAGDEASRTESLRFELGLAQQSRRDVDHFEETSIARMAAAQGDGADRP